MRIKTLLTITPIIVACLSMLGACGGDGSSGDDDGNTLASTSGVLPITADSAQIVTGDVLEAVTSTVDLVEFVDFIGIPVIAGTNSGLVKLLAEEILPCDTGEATVTWNDADSDLVVSTGDTFDMLFVMCFFADTGVTLDGAASLTDMIVTGDPANRITPWRFATTISFDSLSGTDAADTAMLNGSLDLDLSSNDNVIVNLSIGTASLRAWNLPFWDYYTLTDYTLIATFDLNALTEVIRANGKLTKPYRVGADAMPWEGTVTFETLRDFTVIGDDNPSGGQLLISEFSSSVLVTVLDNISVRLAIDLDLDGTIDTTIVVPWTALNFE